MTSRTVGPFSAPAWGGSLAGAEGPGARAAPDPVLLGARGARRGPLADLLGGGAILLAWMVLWSWFALAMLQRPAPAPAAARAAAVQRLA